MPRPKSKPHEVRSRVAGVRLREEEWGGLAQLAETLGETPSRIMRRLIREAINGGPDYFEDGEGEIRKMRYELTTIGRNLNQFARAVNRGERVMSADLQRAFNACTVQMEAVRLAYSHAVEAATARAWRPLYRDGGGGVAVRRTDGAPAFSCPEPHAEHPPAEGPPEKNIEKKQGLRKAPCRHWLLKQFEAGQTLYRSSAASLDAARNKTRGYFRSA